MPTEKTGQHLVPVCYLNGFLSSEVPPRYRDNPNFKHGVWISDATLSSGWKLKAPRNILKKTRYYNLPGDSSKHPIIEDVLQCFENYYTPIRKKIEAQQVLLINEIWLLAIFTMTLYLRVESFQNNFQSMIDQIEDWHRQMDSTENQNYSDEVFQNSEWTTKRMILNLNLAQLIVKQGIQLVVNKTPDVFITSDSPVIHSMRHVDEIAAILGDAGVVSDGFNSSEKYPLILLPLTPNVLLIASRFLRNDHDHFPYIYCSDKDAIFRLKLLSLYNANELLVSSKKTPFGIHEPRVAEVIQNKEIPPELKGDHLLVYTNSKRYFIRITDWKQGMNGLEFSTPDLEVLREIVEDESLDSVVIYDDGHEIERMRDIKFARLDLTGNTSTIIEHRFKLPIHDA